MQHYSESNQCISFQSAYYKTQTTNQIAERSSLAKHDVISKKNSEMMTRKNSRLEKRSNITWKGDIDSKEWNSAILEPFF